ncbi:sensor histidine kinase [Streptomyces aurantiogriseus]|uniref:histidine kinase n=1 Tax=Streptomyces aurantiogriseus TaxID=66870 RepID=A0A918BZV8_9ACTN|nr:ATP-binding protein [Streptomyces aurantiogriseus]GGQ98689.1 ATPase [Streptomyces aurantiogriseus]
MSHLRAPAARADRRESGRHGRPVARPAPAPAETHIRPQLLRLAVLPPTAVALSACAAVLFAVRSTGTRPGPTLWAVLAGAVGVTAAGILIAAVAADRAARSVSDRVAALRRNSAHGEADLRALLDTLRRGEAPPQRTSRGGPPADADEFELLAADLSRAHDGAVTAVVQAAQLSSQAGSEQKLEVFVNLARRLQSLVHREISILDELENEIEDPDLLKGLFHVDHLATRIRRHAENLAVLGGAVSRRQWSNPVSMIEVLRSAIAEVEQYSRVKLVPPIDGELRGHAVADVIHLLAELVENATVFSAPHTQVLLRANLVTSGLAVEVEDRGLGMPAEEQNRMNALLADPDQVNVGRLLADGRIGLFVVSQLARRHGIRVRLQSNIYGGVQAVLVVPQALLGSATVLPVPQAEESRGGAVPAGEDTPGRTPRTVPGQAQVRADTRTPAGRTPTSGPSSQTPAAGPAGRTRTPRTQAAPTAGASPSGTPVTAGGHRRADGPSAQPTSAGGRPPSPAQPRNTSGGERPPLTPQAVPPNPQPVPPNPQAGPGTRLQGGSPVPPGRPQHDAPRVHDRGPAPLPVRGAHEERPNPAEAVPGIRPGDRPVVDENAGRVPTPRAGAVRGTMGKPQLPRRRAQEHIVPQLRGGPAPRQDGEQPAGHDPGLMAAFQRGIVLAEAQQSLEAEALEPAPYTAPDPLRPSPPATDVPHPSALSEARPAHAPAAPEAYGVSGPDHHPTTRHDGSAPAG